MRIRLTAVTWEEAGSLVSDALNTIAERVSRLMDKTSYGANVDAFLGVLVSVDDDENSRWAKPYNRLGTSTDANGAKFKQLCLAVEVPPAELTGKTVAEVEALFVEGLAERLNAKPPRLAKGFDWPSFSVDLRVALAAKGPGQ